MGNHLFDLIRARIPAPDARFALIDDGRVFSYADMVTASGRYAGALVALGVKPGDRVAVQVEKSIEALMLYLGAVRAGAIRFSSRRAACDDVASCRRAPGRIRRAAAARQPEPPTSRRPSNPCSAAGRC